MKSLLVIVIVAILLVNGVPAADGENRGQNVRDLVWKMMEDSRPMCAEKEGLSEDETKEFEERYKLNKLLESDPEKFGGYVGCIMEDWNLFTEDGQLNRKKFDRIARRIKKEEEKQKIKLIEEKLANILEGTTGLSDSGSRCIEAKMKESSNDDS